MGAAHYQTAAVVLVGWRLAENARARAQRAKNTQERGQSESQQADRHANVRLRLIGWRREPWFGRGSPRRPHLHWTSAPHTQEASASFFNARTPERLPAHRKRDPTCCLAFPRTAAPYTARAAHRGAPRLPIRRARAQTHTQHTPRRFSPKGARCCGTMASKRIMKELDDLKGAFESQLAVVERKFGEEATLYRKRSSESDRLARDLVSN